MPTSNSLPPEIVLTIFAYLDRQALSQCARVSSAWYDIALTCLEKLCLQELFSLIERIPVEKDQARQLWRRAYQEDRYLKAIASSLTLHRLMLTHQFEAWIDLLGKSFARAPEIVPMILYNSDFQESVLLNPSGDYYLYNILNNSEEGTCLLLKDPKLDMLKQKLLSKKGILWVKLLAKQHSKATALVLEDASLMKLFFISQLEGLRRVHPHAFSLIENKGSLRGNNAFDADYLLLVTDHQDAFIQAQCQEVEHNETMTVSLESNRYRAFNALDDKKPLFRLALPYYGMHDSEVLSVQVISVKKGYHIEDLVSSIDSDLVSQGMSYTP
jgi:hypothetical protein